MPRFRRVLHPILIMLACVIGLVTARIYLGSGGALLAVAAGFTAIRGFLETEVGVVWGQTTPTPAPHRRGPAGPGGLRTRGGPPPARSPGCHSAPSPGRRDRQPGQTKPDRGVVKMHTRAYKQDGTLVAEFKRAVLVPRRNPG